MVAAVLDGHELFEAGDSVEARWSHDSQNTRRQPTRTSREKPGVEPGDWVAAQIVAVHVPLSDWALGKKTQEGRLNVDQSLATRTYSVHFEGTPQNQVCRME